MSDINFVRVGAALSFVPRTVTASGLLTIALDSRSGAMLELDDGISLTGVKITDGAGQDATGLVAYHETVVILRGKPGATATLVHDSGSVATLGHRIRCSTGADMTLAADTFIVLVYRMAEARWIAYDLRGPAGEQGIQGPAGPSTVTTYSGATAGAGTYSVTFGEPFVNTPRVVASLIGGTPNQSCRVTSRSTTGFTVTAYTRSTVNLLGSEVLLGSTATTNGLTVDVVVFSNE